MIPRLMLLPEEGCLPPQGKMIINELRKVMELRSFSKTPSPLFGEKIKAGHKWPNSLFHYLYEHQSLRYFLLSECKSFPAPDRTSAGKITLLGHNAERIRRRRCSCGVGGNDAEEVCRHARCTARNRNRCCCHISSHGSGSEARCED